MAINNDDQRALKRPRYFDRQQLKAEDLSLEQTYVRQRTQRLNRHLHGCGVVCGLEIGAATAVEGKLTLIVSPGFALSPQGEEIFIAQAQRIETCFPGSGVVNCDNLDAINEDIEQVIYIAVKYAEYQANPVLAVPEDCGPPQNWQNSRICESFELACLDHLPDGCVSSNNIACQDLTTRLYGPNELNNAVSDQNPCLSQSSDHWVVLAKIKLEDDNSITIDYSVRSNVIGGHYLDEMLHCGIAGISSISPDSGTQGETIGATIYGWGLNAVSYVKFSGSDIDAELRADQTHTLEHSGRVGGAVYSSDGSYLAARGTTDKTVRIWNIENAVEVSQISMPSTVIDFAFSPDDTLIAIAQNNGVVQMANVASGHAFIQVNHGTPITAVLFSPVGSFIVTVGSNTQLRVWSADTGQLITQVNDTNNIRKVFFTPDGLDLWVLYQNNVIRKLEVLTGIQRYSFGIDDSTASIIAFDMSSDGLHLAMSDTDGTLRIFNTYFQQFVIVAAVNEYLLEIKFSPDSQRLAASSYYNRLRIYKLWAPNPLIVINTGTSPVTTLCFSHDGKRIAAEMLYSTTAKVWDVSSGQVVTTLSHGNVIDAIAFNPLRQQLATCGMGNQVRLWSIASGKGNALPVNIKIAPHARIGQRPFRIFRNEGQLDSSDTQVTFNVQLAEPTITSISPDNAAAGNTVIISIDGQYLAGANQLVFPGGGISASLSIVTDTYIRATLNISYNAPIGYRRFEITTPRGMVNSGEQGVYLRIWSIYYGSGAYPDGWGMAIGGGLL